MFAMEKAGRIPDIFPRKNLLIFSTIFLTSRKSKVESRKSWKVEKVEKVDYSSESGESITKVEIGDESRFLMSSTL